MEKKCNLFRRFFDLEDSVMGRSTLGKEGLRKERKEGGKKEVREEGRGHVHMCATATVQLSLYACGARNIKF